MRAPSRPPPADFSLLELFSSDTQKSAATLVTGLRDLAEGKADAQALLPELSMAAQSIKGAASIVGLDAARRVSEGLQACLRGLEEGDLARTPEPWGVLREAADLLAAMAALPAHELASGAGTPNAETEQLERRLGALCASPASSRQEPRARGHRPRSARPRSGSVPPVIDATILGLFCTETEACAATLNRGLVQLESGEGAELDELMRAAHSIKGAARIVGMSVVSRLAHAMEDCFVASQERRLELGPRHIDVLLQAVDVLADVATNSGGGLARWQAEKGPLAEALSDQLQKAATGEPIPDLEPTTKGLIAQQAIGQNAGARANAATPALAVPLERKTLERAAPALPASPHERAAPPPQDRVVRVAAQSINRLMGLAGESLVESRRVQSLGGSMQRLKRKQSDLADVLEALSRRPEAALDPQTAAAIADAKSRALECRALLVEQIAGLESYARRVDDLSDRIYREALKSRMRPFGDCVHGLPRMVRDVGRQLGKQVRLVVSGEATDVDRDVLESLEAPLSHLLRNAVDHGIESEADRVAHGKAPIGAIRLEARHHAGMLAITVSDDGRGIDPERIRSKVIERALLRPEVASGLSTTELFEFIFLPGFSTANDVTEVSGRGVGLDAVRTAVEAASGTVRVVSEANRGTQFHLQLPVTRSVMRAVVAEVAGEAYAFPLLRIERILRLPASDVRSVGNLQYFVLGDANIALICAQQILGLGLPPNTQDELCVVIVGDRSHRYGVIVDKFLGERDLVVRPLDTRLGKVQDIAAAAILMDGSPALIFDVEDLVRSIQKLAHAGRVDRLSATGATATERPQKRILVVDDSITVREAERQLLSNHGYSVDVAVDGIDGWNSVSNARYDLIISDIDMPRMNGLELVRTLKQDPKHGAIPIVIVSYKDREEDRMRGLDAGANYYLTKSSFHDESLVQAVEELIGAADS